MAGVVFVTLGVGRKISDTSSTGYIDKGPLWFFILSLNFSSSSGIAMGFGAPGTPAARGPPPDVPNPIAIQDSEEKSSASEEKPPGSFVDGLRGRTYNAIICIAWKFTNPIAKMIKS